jgi:hypothetical protein
MDLDRFLTARRCVGGFWLRLSGQAARNHKRYYQSLTGLRILAFHGTPDKALPHFQRLVSWCADTFEVGYPEDVDNLVRGCFRPTRRDKVLVTLDDGHENNFRAAEWLASLNIKAIFFVIPSYLGRSVEEYLRFHEERGIHAYQIGETHDLSMRGLSPSQVREMSDMGHRIAAHNYSHRDLGQLHDHSELRYEVDQSLDALEDLLGVPCDDFAWSFGYTNHISEEAIRFLEGRCKKVYSCLRGLNVPGTTPAFLLRDWISLNHPLVFSKAVIEGSADHRHVVGRQGLLRGVGAVSATKVH